MEDRQQMLCDRADEMEHFALDATGGDVADALEFVCEGIDGTAVDRLIDKYMNAWEDIELALKAASFKCAVKEMIREEMA